MDNEQVLVLANLMALKLQNKSILAVLSDEQRKGYNKHMSRDIPALENTLKALLSQGSIDVILAELLVDLP